MRKTERYGLNQWAMTDRVLMEDFNADNAKLESALGALASKDSSLDAAVAAAKKELRAELDAARAELAAESQRLDAAKAQWVTLLDETFQSRVQTRIFDLSSEDLTDAWLLYYEVLIAPSNRLTLNYISSSGYASTIIQATLTGAPYGILAYPMKNPNAYHRAVLLSDYSTVYLRSFTDARYQLTPIDSNSSATGTNRFRIPALK